jgi:hypothetical protein
MDEFNLNPLGDSSVGVAAASGRIWIGIRSANPEQSLFEIVISPVADWRSDLAKIDKRFSTVAGFGLFHDSFAFAFLVPYWFAVLLVGAFSFLLWSRVNNRFSLRGLFILTTVLAVVLGMITWLDRACIRKQ